MNVKPYIEYLLGEQINKEKALELLKAESKLTGEEKNLIYAYCYPRNLLDRELPLRIQEYRNKIGCPYGKISPDFGETTLLVEAGRTEQYGRFIKHIMHAFTDPSLISPIAGIETEECPICGKKLYQLDAWSELSKGKPESINKEFLAFGSKESEASICLDCLIQLQQAKNLYNLIDPGFLDWTKRDSCRLVKLGWDSLKLS